MTTTNVNNNNVNKHQHLCCFISSLLHHTRPTDAVWELIGISMASQAFFFVNYIVIRALVVVPLKLIYPHYNVVPGACFGCGLLSTWHAPSTNTYVHANNSVIIRLALSSCHHTTDRFCHYTTDIVIIPLIFTHVPRILPPYYYCMLLSISTSITTCLPQKRGPSAKKRCRLQCTTFAMGGSMGSSCKCSL